MRASDAFWVSIVRFLESLGIPRLPIVPFLESLGIPRASSSFGIPRDPGELQLFCGRELVLLFREVGRQNGKFLDLECLD